MSYTTITVFGAVLLFDQLCRKFKGVDSPRNFNFALIAALHVDKSGTAHS